MATIKTLHALRLASGVVLAAGLVLLAFMVTVEGEPGLLPLVLVGAGGVGLLVTYWRAPGSRGR